MLYLLKFLMKTLLYIALSFLPVVLLAETQLLRIGYDKNAMPKDENYIFKEITFSDEDDLFSKVEATNLQKSLFYQGFYPEFFYNDDFRLEVDYSTNFNQFIYDEYLGKDRHIRDAKKAFELALKDSKKERFQKSSMANSNLASLYLSGIGTEKSVEKALEVLAENPLFDMSIADILNNTVNLGRCNSGSAVVVAYLHYYGVGVEKNIEKANAILEIHNAKISWRNFYAGYLVPQDFDFAIHCLEQSEEYWASAVLKDIYKGKYADKDIDEEKALYWEEVCENRLEEFYLEQKQFYQNRINKISKSPDVLGLSLLYGVEKVLIKKMWYHEEIEFVNPFYDKEKSLKYLSEFEDKYKNSKNRGILNLESKLNTTILDTSGSYYRNVGEIFESYKDLLSKWEGYEE